MSVRVLTKTEVRECVCFSGLNLVQCREHFCCLLFSPAQETIISISTVNFFSHILLIMSTVNWLTSMTNVSHLLSNSGPAWKTWYL